MALAIFASSNAARVPSRLMTDAGNDEGVMRARSPCSSTAAYVRLQSTTDVVVTGATSPVAKLVELHSMSMAGGIMKMRGVPRLVLAAGKPVELTPSGYHLMMTGVKSPLRSGQTVPITLTI